MFILESRGGTVLADYTLVKNRVFEKTEKQKTSKFFLFSESAFLPQGYPESVSKDYLQYQIWDSIQALASSVVGTLAGQAVLIGVGVGNAEATILAATLTWMFRDGAGMIGRIAFAGWGGTSFDSQCKQWRLFADFLNDGALFLELLSAHSTYFFTPIICVSSVLKSLVGLAGGATRAAITQHQALRNNMADVAAKDASQETMSNLIALLVNVFFIYLVTGNWILIWLTFFVLAPLHLYANWRAVRCLCFDTLNRPRFHILISDWAKKLNPDATVITPLLSLDAVNRLESAFWPLFGDLRWSVQMGCSFETLRHLPNCHVPHLFLVFSKERYILYCPEWKNMRNFPTFYICLHEDATSLDQLKAMLHVELILWLGLSDNFPDDRDLNSHFYYDKGIAFTAWSLAKCNEWMPMLIASLTRSSGGLEWRTDTVQFDAGEWRINWADLDEFEARADPKIE